MDLKDAFLLKSRNQKQAEEQEYLSRIFHLGAGHREMAMRRMRELVSEEKTDEELVYAYICVKDVFTGKKYEDYREGLRQWYGKTYMFPEDKKRIVALVLLEAEVDDLSGYPAAGEAIKKALMFEKG